MEQFGGLIDVALGTGNITCQDVVDQYDAIAALPALNVAGGSDTVIAAADQYRQAVGMFADGTRDMAQNCRDFLVSREPGTIPFQQWGVARVRVNEAVAVLNAAARMLQ
jgi:hypothetical protein